MQSRGGYSVPQDSPFELAPRRVAILVAVAAVCAALAFVAGRSMGQDETASSVIGQRAGARAQPVSQRLRAVPDIPALEVPTPEPTSTFPTTPTTPTTPSQSPPAASPAPSSPSPAPAAPAPSAPSGGGGGSFDDSG